MSDSRPYRKRYRRILRDTVRRELERSIDKHLVRDDNLQHYLQQLGIPIEISPLRNSLECARSAVDKCRQITDWFDLVDFWDDVQSSFIGKRGTPDYQAVLAELLVRLHGFWLFILDDTKHTFSFHTSPCPRDEWGDPCKPSVTIEMWPDVAIHFGKSVYYKKGQSDSIQTVLKETIKEYLLRPGEGSVGLGLRADRGVCLRDTVRDLRGAVALEDCLMRNLSYIGLPVFLFESTSRKLGSRKRPFGHFGVFFPASLGWHRPLPTADAWCTHCTFSCSETLSDAEAPGRQKKPICLYERALDLREQFIQPLVAQNYESDSNDGYKARVERIAELGEDPVFQSRAEEPPRRREVFLEKLLPSARRIEANEGDDRARKGDLRIDDFQAVQIWEQHPAIAGLSEGAVSPSESDSTWRQSLRWHYPELFRAQLRQTVLDFVLSPDCPDAGPWDTVKNGCWRAIRDGEFSVLSKQLGRKHRLITVRQKGTSEPDLGSMVACWKRAMELIDSTEISASLDEFAKHVDEPHIASDKKEDERSKRSKAFSHAIVRLKWHRMLRSHVAQCLVARLSNRQESVSPVLFETKEVVAELTRLISEITPLDQPVVVSIVGGADRRLDDTRIELGLRTEPLRQRIEFELTSVGHTLPVFIGLVHAAEKAGFLGAGKGPAIFRTNHGEPSHEGSDWPIQSEAYLPDNGASIHVDCGAETAFSIPSIWEAWCDGFVPGGVNCDDLPPLDHVRLQKEQDDSVHVILYSARIAEQQHSLSFRLVGNTDPCTHFHRLLAYDEPQFQAQHQWGNGALRSLTETCGEITAPRDIVRSVGEREPHGAGDDTRVPRALSQLWRGSEPGHETTVRAASEIARFLATCGSREFCGKCPGAASANAAFFLVLAKVADVWKIERRAVVGDDALSHTCPDFEPFVKSFEHIVESRGKPTHPMGPDFGLTSHVFVPLRRPEQAGQKDRDAGFMVFSGSQIEHDTIRRVDIRPAQRALAQFAADYLEYAISQELQTSEMQATLQGFTHSIGRRGEFLRFGSFSSFVTGIEQFLKNQGFTDFNQFRDMLAKEHPEKAAVFFHLAKLVEAIKPLEKTLKPANRDFDILIEALTKVLAGRPELPFQSEDAETLEHLTSLESWFVHIAGRACRLEEDRHKGCIFKESLPETRCVPIGSAPIGSWAVIVEEVIRNAAKHGLPNCERHLTVEITGDSIVLKCENERKRPGDEEWDSTSSGCREIRKHLRVNYGQESSTTWQILEPRNELYSIHILTFHKAYHNQIRKVYERQYSIHR